MKILVGVETFGGVAEITSNVSIEFATRLELINHELVSVCGGSRVFSCSIVTKGIIEQISNRERIGFDYLAGDQLSNQAGNDIIDVERVDLSRLIELDVVWIDLELALSELLIVILSELVFSKLLVLVANRLVELVFS